MSKTVEVTDANFDEVVNNGVVLVDFWAEWCGPCKMVAPVLEEIAVENDQVTIAKLNVDENPEMSAKFGIRSIPTLAVFKDGQPVDGVAGALPKNAIIQMLNKHL
jgi:thioredoxin 1